jgi:WD40 repeat protein
LSLGRKVTLAGFRPDGSLLLAGEDSGVRLWEAPGGDELRPLPGPELYGRCLAFSPDGSRLLTCSRDGTAIVWDPATGDRLLILSGHLVPINVAAFSPDGRFILTGTGFSFSDTEDSAPLRLWDASSGAEILRFPWKIGSVRSASFSPDGKRISVITGDYTLRVWNLPPMDAPVPDWFGDLLTLRSGRRIDAAGMIRDVEPAGLEALALRLAPFAEGKDVYAEVLRRGLQSVRNRPGSPLLEK